MHHYEFQYQRMMRYLNRLERIEKGIDLGSAYTGDDCIDDIFAFFLNCYHLKDWLKNDAAFTKKTPSEIEDYISNTGCLALCADICNGTKHMAITKPRSNAPYKAEDVNLTAFEGGPKHGQVAFELVIEHCGKSRTALDVARECVQAWDVLMK